MSCCNEKPRWGFWETLGVFLLFAAVAILVTGCAGHSYAQDTPLDISILAKLDAPSAAPVTAKSADALDLSLLDRLDQPAATAPGDALDVTLLDALDGPKGKPAVKPSKAALRSLGAASGVDLGCEIGREHCRPEMPQASLNGVNLRDTAINPPNSRKWNRPDDERQALIEHLIGHPNHSPHGFTFETLNRLDLATLERLHSNDHDHRLNLQASNPATPRQSAATNATGAATVTDGPKPAGTKPTNASTSPPTWGNVTSFQWLDGTYRSSPQPGASYPTLGGVLVPRGSSSTTYQAIGTTRPWDPMERYRGNCPGGVCPVR